MLMDITMEELLNADEEAVRGALRANNELDKSRDACVKTLDDELSRILLRYNAACAQDRRQQAMADCLAATVSDTLGLLRAGTVEKGKPVRQIAGRAIALLLAAVVLCTAAVLLMERVPLAAYGCMVLALLGAFLAGRVWFTQREAPVRAGVNADSAWQTFHRTVETMDRKLRELAEQERELEAVNTASGRKAAPLSAEEVKLFGDLLEALYAKNEAFALRQLGGVPEYLDRRGVTLADYGPQTQELFECFPTKRETATQRPAMLADGKLLQMGKALEHQN